MTLGRVYTRNPVNKDLYVQHYQVALDPIDSYRLKDTRRNNEAKGSHKYVSTTATSAIIKCQGCQYHESQHLVEANQRSHRNFRSPPTCIFKQTADAALLLPIKSHQIYQDITLLKHNLSDLLSQYETNINLSSPNFQLPPTADKTSKDSSRNIDSNSSNSLSYTLVVALIDQFIETSVLSHNLKEITRTLNQDEHLHFYTDGSLQRRPSSIDMMGLGWVVIGYDDIEFSASAVSWPSSTKAEMLAYLTALFVTPYQARVTIYMDSAATIKGFDALMYYRHLSMHKKEKIPNFQIWSIIDHIIDSKQLTLNLVKVKAHSGDILNDQADRLAKAAGSTALQLSINYLSLPSLRLEINYSHLTIEASSRRCVKELCDAKHFSQLLQLQRNSDINLLTAHQHVNWPTTSFMLNFNTTDKDRASTSFKQHKN